MTSDRKWVASSGRVIGFDAGAAGARWVGRIDGQRHLFPGWRQRTAGGGPAGIARIPVSEPLLGDGAELAGESEPRQEMWRLAASAINRARAGLHCGDAVRRAVVVREAAGTLAALSLALEGESPGELAKTAKLLARVADEAEREAHRDRERLRRRAWYAFGYALTAPRRCRSDFERITGQVLNLMVAARARDRAAREGRYAPERIVGPTRGAGR